MSIEEKIAILVHADHKVAYEVYKEFVKLSEETDELYPYFDVFVEMMRDVENSFVRTRGLGLLAYNARWDREHKFEGILLEWLSHIEDEKPITARACIKDAVVLAKTRPEFIETILNALTIQHRIYQESMQSLIYKDRQKAVRQIQQLTW